MNTSDTETLIHRGVKQLCYIAPDEYQQVLVGDGLDPWDAWLVAKAAEILFNDGVQRVAVDR